jgi:hypothetical protein
MIMTTLGRKNSAVIWCMPTFNTKISLAVGSLKLTAAVKIRPNPNNIIF